MFAAEDFSIEFQPQDNYFIVHYQKDGERVTTSEKQLMKSNATKKLVDVLCSSTRQGVTLNTRNKYTE